MEKYFLPLMNDNIDIEDIQCVVDFLSQDKIPKLTNPCDPNYSSKSRFHASLPQNG